MYCSRKIRSSGNVHRYNKFGGWRIGKDIRVFRMGPLLGELLGLLVIVLLIGCRLLCLNSLLGIVGLERIRQIFFGRLLGGLEILWTCFFFGFEYIFLFVYFLGVFGFCEI